MREAQIFVSFQYDVDFSIKELWPDGDAPDIITREAVLDLIKKDGGPNRVVSEWFFPEPNIHIGFAGFDEVGQIKQAEKLFNVKDNA